MTLKVFSSDIGISKFLDENKKPFSLTLGSRCVSEKIRLEGQVSPDRTHNWHVYPNIGRSLVGCEVEMSDDKFTVKVKSEHGDLLFYKVGVFTYKPYAFMHKRHASRGHLTIVYDFNKRPQNAPDITLAERGSAR